MNKTAFKKRVADAFLSFGEKKKNLEELDLVLKKMHGANGEYVFTFWMADGDAKGLASKLLSSSVKTRPDYAASSGETALFAWLLIDRCSCQECSNDLSYAQLRLNEFVLVTTAVMDHLDFTERLNVK
jgi:hypothetical protein